MAKEVNCDISFLFCLLQLMLRIKLSISLFYPGWSKIKTVYNTEISSRWTNLHVFQAGKSEPGAAD